MHSTASSPPPRTLLLNPQSRGAKFFLICLLAILMSLPGLFVAGLTRERAALHGVTVSSSDAASKGHSILGIRLVDSYRSTERSLHYITLFLGLVFLTYFLFEITSARQVHLAQYVMVGVAQLIFYLLLLSLAEHLGFDVSFLIAGGCTVALFAVNTEWVFRSRSLAVRALAAFSLLYAFIYILLRLEAYALLLGAFAAFAAIAAAMYLTRDVDWYGSASAARGAVATPPAARESWLD